MSAIIEKIKTNPALVIGFVTAVITVLVTLGLDISAEATAAINGLVIAALAFVTRAKVKPV